MEFYNIWEIAAAFKVVYTLSGLLNIFLLILLTRSSETNKGRNIKRLMSNQHYVLRRAAKIKKASCSIEAKKELIPKLTSSNLFGIKSILLLP